MLWLDHVVRIVSDFASTEAWLHEHYGLVATRWEVFADSGVASRLFVLGGTGIELMGIQEHAKAAHHPFGQAVLKALAGGERWLGTAIGTDELDVHAARLGLSPTPISSVSSEGVLSEFRLLGNPLSNPPSLPFLIEWSEGTDPWPQAEAARNPDFSGVASVALSGDTKALSHHLGEDCDFLVVSEGAPRISAVTVSAGAGDVRIE
ncbi:MAG: VOC family protein [Myxococcota bacterium]